MSDPFADGAAADNGTAMQSPLSPTAAAAAVPGAGPLSPSALSPNGADGSGSFGFGFNAGSPSSSPSAGGARSGGADLQLDLLPEATRFDPALVRPLQLGLGEDLLLPFVEEYSKLQQALLKSHDSETRFVNKCKALSKQTRAHTHKLTALHSIHMQDQKRKSMLTAEIDKHKMLLQRLADEMKEKKEGVRSLRQELQTLGAQLEESSNDFLRSQRSNIAKLELEVNKYTLIRDKDRSGLTKIRSKNVDQFKALQDLLAACSRSQQEFDGLEAKLLEARAMSGKELRRKAELEKHMKDVQARVADRQNQLAAKKDLIAKAAKELADVELQLHKSDKVVELHRAQYEELNDAARAANDALLEIQESNETLVASLKKLAREVDEDKAATRAAKAASEAKLRALESMRERVRVLGEETRSEEDEKAATQAKMKLLAERISAVQFKLNSNAKAMDTCVREREVLAQNHSAKIDAIKAKEAALKIKHSTLKNIKNEHQGYLISIRALTKILEELKRDKAAHEADLQRRLVQKARALEEVSARELQITEYQAQIVINEGKFRQQQNLLEAVRSDRNMYRKTLIEQQTEMHEFKRKFHFLSTQVRQSKSEIEDKNQLIVFEHFNLQNVRDDIEQLETQNSNTFRSLEKGDALIRGQAQQIRKLSTIIADADEELRVQIKQYNSIVNEQRVLNQQLVKRNEELATLYEQLKLQNSILTKSAGHYKEKQILLAEFEAEHALVNQSLGAVLGDVGQFAELRSTISELQTQLVQEQLKVKALADELRKPINIHRWRRLMDTDTDTYGMIKKVRQLQADIIAKAAAVGSKDRAIQEKEKLYVDLRRVLARQPGSEAADQLRVYLEQLDEKKAKLKSIKAELRLYQTRVKESHYEIKKIDADLQLIKLSFFERRRQQQRKAGGGGGGGGGPDGRPSGQAWRGDSAGGARNGGGGGGDDGYDDLPAILRPTEFPVFNPPADLGAENQPPRSADRQSHLISGANPYMQSAAAAAAGTDPFPSASASSSSSAAARAFHSQSQSQRRPDSARGLDSASDSEVDDADADFRHDEKEDSGLAQRRQSRPLPAAPAESSSSRSALRSARRDQRSAGGSRPDSRGGMAPPEGMAAAINMASYSNSNSIGQLSQRSDGRGAGSGSLSQRGDANFSRFPSIGNAQQ